MRTGPAALVVALALAAAGGAHAGSGPDKAGGRGERTKPPAERIVLTLATGDPEYGEAYARAVARVSDGSIRIDVRGGRDAQANYERFTIEDVRKGRAELGSVGARVWDTMGATSMRALVAPLLVDSLALQKRILEGPLATQMLAGLARAGVVGLALTPGPLRRPLGMTRALRGPRDYAGATIGIKFGGVARSTFEALGAKVKGYTFGAAPFDGAELDLKTIADARYDPRAKEVTANVVLWARPQTVFANRAAFDRLTPRQRAILRSAGREAVRPEAARIETEQKEALSVICGRSPSVLATASAAEIAALRGAVRPVYAELERDRQTRQLIAAIRKLRTSGSLDDGEPARCFGAGNGADALEGSWRSTVSREEMLAGGASVAEAATYAGTATLELARGKWVIRNERATVTGTYSVVGEVLRMTVRTCTANPCAPGMTTEYTWSVYRDKLTLARASSTTWPRLVARPLARVP